MIKKINQRARGLEIEFLVAKEFTKKGWQLLKRNYQWKGGEIDLVFFDLEHVLVFIEVRSSSESSCLLRYSLSPSKKKRLLKTAQHFCLSQRWFGKVPVRFDVVWVEDQRLEHWKNVLLN